MSVEHAIRAGRIVGPGRIEIQGQPMPHPTATMTVVSPAYVGLCGTDVDLLEGTMAYFAAGLARHPLQPGHEWSGRVRASHDPRLRPGQHVIMDPIVGCGRCPRCHADRFAHCRDRWEFGVRRGMEGALATAVAAPSDNLIPVPDGVPLRDAVLVEPMVTVLAGVERASPGEGDRALVVGAGTLGLLATMILAARGLDTHVLVRDRVREGAVEEAGGRPWRPDDAGGGPGSGPFEVVIEAAGSPEAVQAALRHVAPGGRVALLGIPAAPVELDVAALVVGDVSAHGVLNGPGQFATALASLASGVVRPEVVIDRVYPFEDLREAYDRSREPGRARPKVLVQVDPSAHAG